MPYNSPTDLNRALQLFSAQDGRQNSRIIAGGTDIFPSLGQGQRPENLIDITAIPALSGVTFTENIIRIGAATTWREIIKTSLPPAFDALKQAAGEIGSIQIQNVGTIGGNLCNASPAADGVPPLLALDSCVELASITRGIRTLKLSEFILDVRKTALADDEIVTAVLVPTPSLNMKSAFEKLGSRHYLVISITMVAAIIECDRDGTILTAKIAAGSCSPVAQRLGRLETAIIGQRAENIEILPEHLSSLSPIDDIRASRDYRLDVVAEQCRRAIREASSN